MMWRSVFLHEFPGGRIRAMQALAGDATPASLAMTPEVDADLGRHVLTLSGDQVFDYGLDQPLRAIVGLSVRVRLHFPYRRSSRVPVVRVGPVFELALQPEPMPNDAPSRASAVLRVAGANPIELGTVVDYRRPHARYVDLRVDWHSSGQARLLVDGRLAGFQHSVAVGLSLGIDRIVLGGRPEYPGPPGARFMVSRVMVRALSERDSLGPMVKGLPDIRPADDPRLARCRKRVQAELGTTLMQLRQLMARFHALTSQPWTSQGPGPGPFKEVAKEAHAAALKAGMALGRTLSDPQYPFDDVLAALRDFLVLVRGVVPVEFKALVDAQSASHGLSEECRDLLEREIGADPAFERLSKLLGSIHELIVNVAGGN
jgi:hypothetical protein